MRRRGSAIDPNARHRANPERDAEILRWSSRRSDRQKLYDNLDFARFARFAPKAPAGLGSNWIETVPGKGFCAFLRFYGLEESLFDGTWKLPDIELID